MLNIVKEFEAARKYKKYGWTIVSEKQQSRAMDYRKEKYQDDLNRALDLLKDWKTPEELAEMMGVNFSTAKKYLYELLERDSVERMKMPKVRKPYFVYRSFSANRLTLSVSNNSFT